jgi:ATPase subunit of ABC transporter with duplicated ATPase domains
MSCINVNELKMSKSKNRKGQSKKAAHNRRMLDQQRFSQKAKAKLEQEARKEEMDKMMAEFQASMENRQNISKLFPEDTQLDFGKMLEAAGVKGFGELLPIVSACTKEELASIEAGVMTCLEPTKKQ